MGGDIEIVKLIIKHGENDWNIGLQDACLYGHVNVVCLMIQLGADNWRQGLSQVCEGLNNDNGVRLTLERPYKNNFIKIANPMVFQRCW